MEIRWGARRARVGGRGVGADLSFSFDDDHINRTRQSGRVDARIVVVRPRKVLQTEQGHTQTCDQRD